MKSTFPSFSLRAQQQIQFAEGWLGLGNADEADKELANLDSTEAQHPDVLALKWSIHASIGRWEAAYRVALTQLQTDIDDVRGWINQSYALRRLPGSGIPEAMEALLPALEKFPREMLISYNLACYQCCLGNQEQARKYLKSALKIGVRRQVLALATDDPDLAPIRGELPSL